MNSDLHYLSQIFICSKSENEEEKFVANRFNATGLLYSAGRLSKHFCLLLIILFSITLSVTAQTNTWDGSSSANWNTAANWSLNQVPTAAHDVVIPNGITANITVN
mgnify:FL=1